MTYCFNPKCSKPENPKNNKFCQNCGKKLLLAQRYRGQKILGAGGFGRTILAEDESQPSKPRCAIKQFYPQNQNNVQKATELFRQEALRLAELGKHPQIPELLNHFEEDNYLYIVQEFIDGENLTQELAENGAFSEAEIRSLLSDLLPVLQAIHNVNIIHRDIKPENIIRRRLDRKLVLVDFGAAKYATATRLAKTGTTIGSAGYAAPEQAFGKAVFASDIYSLGVTSIHLLTQIEPFDLYDPIESGFVWQDYLVDNPVSDELAEILNRMIHTTVRQRYQSAEEAMAALGMLGESYTKKTITTKIATIKASLITTLSGHLDPVYGLAFSPDRKTIASASGDNTVKLWQISMAWEIRTLGGWFSKHLDAVYTVAFSPDGKTIASGSGDKNIKLWNVQTGQEICTLKGHSNSVNSVAFSPDGQTLVSGSADQTIKFWDIATLTQTYSLFKHSSLVYGVAFSPDGKIIASGSADRTIKLWDVETGLELATLEGHTNSIHAIAFSPDGMTLASGSSDFTIKLWDINKLKEKHTLKGHLVRVRALAFSPDGQILVSGSVDKTIKFWDLPTGQEICNLKQHFNSVCAVAFSSDGQTLASGSEDKTIKIWRINR
ncbi:protein kinase [Symplocastrum sp. BBK-W-15]|uniref:Protein kinase n=2 Tax=Limnofasciculus TaxID=3064905 RepID=A0AAE3GXN5_9CYAN|nr:protein kinase [Limnofasciculus baicalensis BBK-W-15]